MRTGSLPRGGARRLIRRRRRDNAVIARLVSRVTGRGIDSAEAVVLPPKLHLPNRLEVSIRAVTWQDEDAIFTFLAGLSLDSRRKRFFTAVVDLHAEAHRGAAGDDVDHHGVLAIVPERGVVGHAMYVRVPGSERAEVAVEVVDDLHRMGLATALLIRLAQFAESRQIVRFFAEVLPENRGMLAIFCGRFEAAATVRSDGVDIEFDTSTWRKVSRRYRVP